jgi:hypothetical protein
MTSDELRHGRPDAHRDDTYKFDKYVWPADGDHWPDGLEITIYDDGRVKVGGWHTTAAVLDVSNYREGKSKGGSHVIAQFRPASQTHG